MDPRPNYLNCPSPGEPPPLADHFKHVTNAVLTKCQQSCSWLLLMVQSFWPTMVISANTV